MPSTSVPLSRPNTPKSLGTTRLTSIGSRSCSVVPGTTQTVYTSGRGGLSTFVSDVRLLPFVCIVPAYARAESWRRTIACPCLYVGQSINSAFGGKDRTKNGVTDQRHLIAGGASERHTVFMLRCTVCHCVHYKSYIQI